MPATMKDIASDLGVSIVTVSKVLRNHSDISDATRKRVLKRVKELNYQPKGGAQPGDAAHPDGGFGRARPRQPFFRGSGKGHGPQITSQGLPPDYFFI